jgi:hypothetical protein
MVVESEAGQPVETSHLFTLRLWPEELGGGQTEWRGKVQHVNGGEVRYFRDWPTLEAFVEGLLVGSELQGTLASGTEKTDRASRFT